MTHASTDRKRMRIAFGANMVMFVVGLIGWQIGDSAGLLADAFDMLADASGYALAWIAIGQSRQFQTNAARWNGTMLIGLGIGVIGEVIHRFIVGSTPHGLVIFAFAALSLAVNGSVLFMLKVYRDSKDVHLKATWIDTRADVVVNASVLLSGAAIALTGYRQIDLLVGLAIALYVIKEGVEIWEAANDNT